ncbi:DUF456 domain-containing protein [Oceanobacillus timonensis]|uniref:DUF456 domain-containing protein n=1 Tax=Oceanobacillus timonensis TaxID=1926285 RepID=UPI0009BAFFCB|nr:DUF456 domain-containing protein [Oceanobacillus timonensis]
MDILLWSLIIILFIVSFVGIVFPVIPSVIVIWVGFFIYHFLINNDSLTWWFWTGMIVITVILLVADIIANSYFVKKFGGSKAGERGAAVAVIVGSFITPPFGIIYIPFLTVLVIEMIQRRTAREAIRASIGSFLGFLGGSVAKVVLQLIMIVWFFIAVWF